MAAITIDQVNDIIADAFPRHFADATANRAVFFDFLRNSGRIRPPSDAKGPRWEVKITPHSGAGRYASGDPLPAASSYAALTPQLGWAEYVGVIELPGKQRAELAQTGDLLIGSYLATQMEDCAMQILRSLNADLLGTDASGSTPPGVVGIQTWADNSGTVAGIDRSTYSAFQASVDDTSEAISLADVRTGASTLVDTNEGGFSAIFTTSALADAYMGLTGQPTVTVNLPAAGGAPVAPETGRGLAMQMSPRGYFRGAPIYAVPGYATGRFDMIDTSGLVLEVLEDTTGAPVLEIIGDTWRWHSVFRCAFYLQNPKKQAFSLQAKTTS